MRKFYGKPAATIKYLRKRKRKRKEFTKRLDAYDYSTAVPETDENAAGNGNGKEMAADEMEEETSDESQEYNYYTTSDDEEGGTSSEENGNNDDELIGYFRLRAFLALMLPISVSASIGAFLFKQKLKGEVSQKSNNGDIKKKQWTDLSWLVTWHDWLNYLREGNWGIWPRTICEYINKI